MCLSVLEGGWDQSTVLILSVISLTCLTPLPRPCSVLLSIVVRGKSSEKKSVRDWPISCANCRAPKQLISSLWRLAPVIIETLRKFSWQTEGCPGTLQDICVCRKIMSSGLQALYLMFLSATQSLVSSSLCLFWRMFFRRMITVVIWCQSALPTASSCNFKWGLYPPPVIPAGIRSFLRNPAESGGIRRNPVEYNLAGSSAKLPFRGQ